MTPVTSKTRSQRSRREELWSFRRAAVVGMLMGTGTSIAIGLITLLDTTFGSWTWGLQMAALPVVVVGFPIIVQALKHRRLRTWWHAVVLGGSYGASIMVSGIGGLYVFALLRGDKIFFPGSHWQILFGVLGYAVFGGGLLLTCWGAARVGRGRLRVIDGTKCPNCQYELKGCTSNVCPECGEAFEIDLMATEAVDATRGP